MSSRQEIARNVQQAARGGTAPSVEAGRLVVLEWGERRRHQRFDVDVVAIARSSEGEARVRIIDISVGGVCIQGMPPMAEGAAISLRLQDERSMSGKIRWQTAGRTGVRFDNELLPDDPLLSASV